MQKYLDILGHRVVDRVTGFKGVAVSVSFDLYGCIQVIVNPGLQSDGKLGESNWFDFNRLKVETEFPVMQSPDYEYTMSPQGMAESAHGCADRPSTMSKV